MSNTGYSMSQVHKKAHDWPADQLADLFRTTQKAKTRQVTRSRGQQCGDIELTGYLVNVTGPVPLVLDLRITHDRFGSSSVPSLNEHLHYPNDLDGTLTESAAAAIATTSTCLHSEFVRLLFLQAHRETYRFFAASGVQLPPRS